METTLDETVLAQWIGRSEEHHDLIDLKHAHLMQMTLDREPLLKNGDPLPSLWHWIYFLQSARMSELGRDGHPALGGFLPPVALPRRMWAGGRLEFFKPLRIGEQSTKVSTIQKIIPKQGRSGKLCFVTVRHEISANGSCCLAEEHDIVYREDSSPDTTKPKGMVPPYTPEWSEKITPSAVMLFRYSALTFNGHRIHYDRDYARSVEGYPDLVFHGPLTATLLADIAVRNNPDQQLSSFSFKGVAPLFDANPFTIHGKSNEKDFELWAASPQGDLAMTARASFKSS